MDGRTLAVVAPISQYCEHQISLHPSSLYDSYHDTGRNYPFPSQIATLRLQALPDQVSPGLVVIVSRTTLDYRWYLVGEPLDARPWTTGLKLARSP